MTHTVRTFLNVPLTIPTTDAFEVRGEGVFVYDSEVSDMEFYTVYKPNLTEADIQEYLTYKQLSLIKTIKNCVVFFTVLIIISLVASFIVFSGILR